MYFHVYNCPNDRHCLVLVSEKTQIQGKDYICVCKSAQSGDILANKDKPFSWKIKKYTYKFIILIFFLCYSPYPCVADYHLCPFGQFTKVFLFQRLSGTAPLQENIAALQMPLSCKISCPSPAADDLGFPQKLMNCSTGTHLHTTPGLQELPGHADGRHTSAAVPVGTDGMS